MQPDVFQLDLEKYPIGKKIIENVKFPSFYGVTQVESPLFVYRATKEIHPCVVVTACVHGDEINGMHIAQKIMKSKLKLKYGTLIIMPVVNIYGCLTKSRYLPDRRDLNRCFPGSKKGSFGARFADFILGNITRYGDFFVDLHSGGVGRFNVPQIRCDLSQEQVRKMVEKISIPLVVNSSIRDGSMREALTDLGKPCLVFEGGEGDRIDETITKYGVNLVKSILCSLDMIAVKKAFNLDKMVIQKTRWIRAKQSGVLINRGKQGSVVKEGETIGELRRISGNLLTDIKIPHDGIVLGIGKISMIMAGDPLYNIGYLDTEYEPEDEEEYFDYFEL